MLLEMRRNHFVRLTLTRIPVFLLQAGRYFFEVQALRCEFARVAWLIVSEGCIRKGSDNGGMLSL